MPEIRTFRKEDFPSLLELVHACYPGQAEPPEWWQWRHFQPSYPVGSMVLALERNRVIGMRPITFFDYAVNGRKTKAALFNAAMVHPEYRGQGVFKRLVDRALEIAWEEGATFVSTMPNQLSYPAFIKMGWLDLGDRVLLVRPLRLRSILGVLFGARSGSRAESPPAAQSQVEESGDVLSRSETDCLAHAVASDWPGIMLLRNTDWLSWRFEGNRWNSYAKTVTRDGAGRLSGFCITNREHRRGLHVGYVVDLVSEDRSARRELILEASRLLRDAGCDLLLSVVSPSPLVDAFRSAGYVRVPNRLSPKAFHTVCKANPDGPVIPGLSDIRQWYLTLGDWDGI